MTRRPPNSPLFPTPPLSRPAGRAETAEPRLESRHRRLIGGRLPLDRVARRQDAAEIRRHHADVDGRAAEGEDRQPGDRKSTRLNSSHANISYAVFCLKKNNI